MASGMEGTIVSHFEVGERLGGGGMGVVYAAEDLKLRRRVALKFLPPDMTRDEGARERFVREAQAASALDHPNICTIYEIDETDDGQVFMAMAYYPGETLRREIEAGPMRVSRAVDVAIELAAALEAAHERGIVHRDVKPSNVQITRDAGVKLLDFGLAKLQNQSRLTRSGAVVGTVAYMSPEQLQSETLDGRTDLWSLGVVMYEMLTGDIPFGGESEPAMILSIVQREAPDLGTLQPSVAPEVGAIVHRLLAKNPNHRYQSATSLRLDLEAARQRMSTAMTETLIDGPRVASARSAARGGSHRPSVPESEEAVRPRLPVSAWAAMVLVALAVAAGTVWWGSRSDSSLAPDEIPGTLAVLPFSNMTDDPGRDFVPRGLSAVLIAQLSELDEVHVIGSSEAWAYSRQGVTLSATKLASELGADAVLEGSYFERDGRGVVQLSLLNGTDGRILWSEQVEAAIDDLLDLQGRLVRRLARDLAAPLSAEAESRLAASAPANEEVYRTYLEAVALVESLGEAGAIDRALTLFRRTVDEDPGFSAGWAGLSRALLLVWNREGDPETIAEAEAAARRALELAPERPEAVIAVARVLEHTGGADEAIELLLELTADWPDRPEAHVQLAAAYDEAGRADRAEASLRRAIALRPDYWSYWNELGTHLLSVGEYDEAVEVFERAVELTDIELSHPVQNLASIALARGDAEKALELYERLDLTVMEDAGLATNVGTAYFFLGDFESAERYYRLAVRLAPSWPMYWANLADCLVEQGRLEDAAAEYGRAADLQAERVASAPSRSGRLRLALYSAKAGRCESALEEGASIAASPTDSWSSEYSLAKVFAVCRSVEDTLDTLERAARLGLAPARLESDPEFEFLAGEPRFEALIDAPAVGS